MNDVDARTDTMAETLRDAVKRVQAVLDEEDESSVRLMRRAEYDNLKTAINKLSSVADYLDRTLAAGGDGPDWRAVLENPDSDNIRLHDGGGSFSMDPDLILDAADKLED